MSRFVLRSGAWSYRSSWWSKDPGRLRVLVGIEDSRVETKEMVRALAEGWTPKTARCRVCGVYAVRVGKPPRLMLYCIVGCPCDDPDVDSLLASLGEAEAIEEQIELWVKEWISEGRRVP